MAAPNHLLTLRDRLVTLHAAGTNLAGVCSDVEYKLTMGDSQASSALIHFRRPSADEYELGFSDAPLGDMPANAWPVIMRAAQRKLISWALAWEKAVEAFVAFPRPCPLDDPSQPAHERWSARLHNCLNCINRGLPDPLCDQFRIPPLAWWRGADALKQFISDLDDASAAIATIEGGEVVQPPQADATPPTAGYVSSSDLAAKYDRGPEAVRKKLERYRNKNKACYRKVEAEDRLSTEPEYLYLEAAVLDIIMACPVQLSGKRPA